MHRVAMITVLGLSLLGVSVGCSAPVYNVTNRPIPPIEEKPRTVESVKAEIMSAGEIRGWTMKDIEPGRLEGILRVRVHVAVVDIKYSTTGYSITYKDSYQLNYDGSQIHMEYNNWVRGLEEAIDGRLKLE
jgi:hypothetical protein